MYMHAEQCSWLHTRCRSKAVMSSLCRTRTCHLPNTLSRGMSRAGAHSQQACRMHPDMLYRAVPCRISILNDHLSFRGRRRLVWWSSLLPLGGPKNRRGRCAKKHTRRAYMSVWEHLSSRDAAQSGATGTKVSSCHLFTHRTRFASRASINFTLRHHDTA